MAHITFNKTSTGIIVIVAGIITPSTTKLIQQYTKKHKLDVQSTILKDEFGFTPSYLQHEVANK